MFRFRPEVLRAIEILREHDEGRATWAKDDLPASLTCPEGAWLRLEPGDESVNGAVELVRGEYWNDGIAPEVIARVHRDANASIVAEDGPRSSPKTDRGRSLGSGGREVSEAPYSARCSTIRGYAPHASCG